MTTATTTATATLRPRHNRVLQNGYYNAAPRPFFPFSLLSYLAGKKNFLDPVEAGKLGVE